MLLFVVALLASPGPTSAPQATTHSTPPRTQRFSPWHLDVGVQTSVPLDVAARVDVELPARVQLTTSLGAVPKSYVDIINRVVVAADGYEEDTAALIRDSLSRALVWRLRAGWRPFSRFGLHVGAGYGLVALGGATERSDVTAVLVNNSTPLAAAGMSDNYTVETTLHAIDIEIGWRFLLLRDNLVLRPALGYLGTLRSRSTLTPEFTPATPRLEAELRQSATDELDALLRRYAHVPMVTFTAAWRVF